jgi:membrane-associated phospholipid phosphatase
MKTPSGYTIILYTTYAVTILTLILVHTLLGPTQTVIAINGWNNPLLDQLMVSITNLGNGIVFLPFFFLLLFHRLYLSFALLLNALFQGVLSILFKRILFPDALRPINYIDTASVHLIPGVHIHKAMSFPSGHTMTIFGLCVFLSLCFRHRLLAIFLIALSTLVGLSRVYLLQHFALDVGIGALLGLIAGTSAYYLFERSRKPHWMSSRFELKLKRTSQEPKFS